MRNSSLLALLGLLSASALAAKLPKRGLAAVGSKDWPEDDAIWVGESSPISWYYNFYWNVSAVYASVPQDQVEYVPMLWGGGVNDTDFLSNITEMIKPSSGAGGRNITHVMGFNLPDQLFSDGGSEMKPADAAQSWVHNLLPLREKFGIKLGLPVVGDPRGGWVDPFLKNCSRLNDNKECKFDFVPLHAFGQFGVLQDRVGKFSSAFPGVPLWIVEYGYNDQNLATTQEYFNQSLTFLDDNKAVERYSWFGAFRSTVSNVGPNMAMLDPWGNLTDIGSWYLGGNATGKAAMPNDTPRTNACSAEHPCTDADKNAGTELSNGRSLGLWWSGAASCLLLLLL
ncbi:glycosyl hydrolase catalytic core-domain-containing protein [Chaetomidium leptoderma]|uniref:Glycosyl hydrolase catalytic core-domain-containing protein n=1 Tax=Chaetomidium leptoderma TaxID=669021 RepID=A0AAN7A139_9PEZI|nr:glycosyl hydrolase catalytic core-domain-containing protein [Chaetomidium leptoderma]